MPTIFYHAPPPHKPKPVPSVMTVKQYHPWVCPVVSTLTIIVLVGLGMFLHRNSVQTIKQSRYTFIEQHLQTQQKSRQQLEKTLQENAHLTAQNKELREKLVTMVRTTDGSQTTYAEVLQSLNQLQEKIHDLKEELTFYKRLLISPISSASSTQGVMVNNFTVSYDKVSGHYPYKLVLIQEAKNAKVASGTVQINIVGQGNGSVQRLSMKQLTDNAIEALDYKFIYFKRLEEELQLPKGFIPHYLIVRILPKDQQKANKIRFNWKDLQPKEQP
jgi:hypothetical protein